MRTYEALVRLDNTANDFDEYHQAYDFVINHMADEAPGCRLFLDATEIDDADGSTDYESALHLCLDPRYDELEIAPLSRQNHRYWELTLPMVERGDLQ